MSEKRDKLEQARREVAAWITLPRAGAPPPREEARLILRALERAEAENEALRAGLSCALDDLAALLQALGESDVARPETPHHVMLACVEKVKALRAEVAHLKANNRYQAGYPDDFCASCAPDKLRKARVALLLDAAAFARIRMRWPHIEVPTRGSVGILGHQVLVDPGSPTCLRCSIEEEIRGPVASGEESRAEEPGR